ncbi:MAG: hypothetical protein OXG88_08865 [Gammaproteobacteria bacterium]|nr:hypothetical protein [Gammaproteobacteria bacterium]
MTKLIDHSFNYLRFALFGVAMAFVILGPAALGSTPTQTTGKNIYVPPDAYYGSSSSLACDISISDPMAVHVMSGTGFWDCVANNTATCGLGWATACTLAGIVAQAAFLVTGWGAAVALAKAAGTRAGRWVINRIIALIKKIPDVSFPVGNKVVTIPFSSFATWASTALGSTVIAVLLLSAYQLGRRACKCLVC